MPTYQLEPRLAPAEFIEVLTRSTLAERRPLDRPAVIQAVLEHADIIVTARIEEELVGVLLAALNARTYYPHIGMERHDSARTIPRTSLKEWFV